MGVCGAALIASPPLELIGGLIGTGGVVVTIAAIALVSAGVAFDKIANINNKDASKIRSEAAADLSDLNRYMEDMSHNPIANNMTLNTTIEEPLINVLNVTDPDGALLKVHILKYPTNGVLNATDEFNNTPNFTYTPKKDFHGQDSFIYEVIDSNGLISNNATVNITVINNHLPVAENITINLSNRKPNSSITGQFNASDKDGDLLIAIIENNPIHGFVNIFHLTFEYTDTNPIGKLKKDYFSYRVKDGNGGISNLAWVNITYIPPLQLRL